MQTLAYVLSYIYTSEEHIQAIQRNKIVKSSYKTCPELPQTNPCEIIGGSYDDVMKELKIKIDEKNNCIDIRNTSEIIKDE